MSREFSLVLLGAGILTAGYFAAPSPDEEVEKKAEEQAARRTGHTHYRGGHFFFVHSMGYAGAGTAPGKAAAPTVSRSGFGGVGRAMGGGGASS
jgi:hypothetical protein